MFAVFAGVLAKRSPSMKLPTKPLVSVNAYRYSYNSHYVVNPSNGRAVISISTPLCSRTISSFTFESIFVVPSALNSAVLR
jgi:hypothetical protein